MESKLSATLKVARFSDADLHERLSRILNSSPLFDRAAEIGLSVSLAESATTTASFLSLFKEFEGVLTTFLGVRRFASTFANEGPIPLKRMLIDIERLLPLVSQLERSLYKKDAEADQDFRPSNVDREKVKALLDNAIFELDRAAFSNEATRLQLKDYLASATSELSKEDPNWRKLVGALVISATILSGIAVAPDAVKNINDALRYVLGTSVDFQPNLDGFGARLPQPMSE